MTEATTIDLYAVLGVARDAPAHEIRRAYRRLARQHHPDINPQSGGADQFATVANAYEILHDPARRADYDRTLPGPVTVGRPADRSYRPGPPARASVRHGILQLSHAEALHLTRGALVLHDDHGRTIVLPAGTGHGDQITLRCGAYTAVLAIQTPRKT